MRRNDISNLDDDGQTPTPLAVAMIAFVLAAIAGLVWLLFISPLQVWVAVSGI